MEAMDIPLQEQVLEAEVLDLTNWKGFLLSIL